MRVRKAFADGPFGQVHYRIAGPAADGARTPVVCLHMSPKSGRSFERVVAELGEDRMALAPDYPGYGESDPPPADPPVTIADYAAAVWAVIDAAGLQGVDFVGAHTGSLVAVEAAGQRPDQTRRLALISAPIASADELAAFRTLYEPIPLDEAGTRFRVMWDRIALHRGPDMTLEMMAQSLAENLRGGEAYEWGHRAAFDYMESAFADALRRLAHPTIVFNPADDLSAHTARAASLLPDGVPIVDKPSWGHGFLVSRAQEFATALRAFFDAP